MLGRGFEEVKDAFFWKQILRKSNINLGFALSSIAAERFMEQVFGGWSLSGGLLESLESVESRENNIIIRHNNLFVNFV